ncbi:MAG: MarR family transcriptional regulator [Acidimicrobiales bacterium]|jgi:DNA-binding transcriptional regulator GbsR (MarR family)
MSAGRFPHCRDVADVDWRTGFVEDMAAFVLVNGTPRAVLRVLGWMVVCEQPEQTASDIQENLELSAGSVSAAVRSLCDGGMLERSTRPGDRRIYYRLREHAWEKALAARFRGLTEVRRVAERAIDAAGGDADERLIEMRDTYALVEAGLDELLCHSREHTGGEPAAGTRIAAHA